MLQVELVGGGSRATKCRVRFILVALLCGEVLAKAATFQVGPGKQFAQPCDGIAAARGGDLVLIDATGNYTGNLCSWEYSGITIRGVNGRPKINGGGRSAQDKGIWVISGADTVIENIEFLGAKSSDQNGAAIRQEGPNLTLRNCFIHDNEEGILIDDSPKSTVLIEFSEFANNGSGDGYTHNIYVNHIAKLTLQYSYSHGAKVGHLLKSRAAENYILYNRLTAESAGSPSYKIDLSNGGLSYVIGNLIEQSALDSNDILLAYMAEGADPLNPGKQLYVINNTMVNDAATGTFIATFGNHTTLPVVVRNNILSGPGLPVDQKAALMDNNLVRTDPMFVNAKAFDYHLRPGSPAIKSGSSAGPLLDPAFEYVHPVCAETRMPSGTIDIGAHQFGSSGTLLMCNAAPLSIVIAPEDILNAASFAPTTISPGELVVIYGTNFGPNGLIVSDQSTSEVPSEVAGVRISFDGKPAPILYSDRGVISAVVPFALAGQKSALMNVVFNGVSSNALSLPVSDAAPGIFTVSSGRDQAAALNSDGNANSVTAPADRGSVISLFGTGLGATDPPGVDGRIAPATLVRPLLPTAVKIGDIDAEILFVGVAPGLVAGVFQIDVRVPAMAIPGNSVPLVLTIGSFASQSKVTLALR